MPVGRSPSAMAMLGAQAGHRAKAKRKISPCRTAIGKRRAAASRARAVEGFVANGQLEHDPETWEPVFGKRSCSNKELERDDDSSRSSTPLAHPASSAGQAFQ